MVLVGIELAVTAGERVARVAEEHQRLVLVHGAVHGARSLLRLAAACGKQGVTSPRCHHDVTGTPAGPVGRVGVPVGQGMDDNDALLNAPEGRAGYKVTASGRTVTAR